MNNSSLNALSDEILGTLRRRPSAFHTLEKLAQKHHCPKADIQVALDLLRQTGYEFEIDKREAVRFVSAPDLLLAAEITHGLKTAFFGKTVYAYKSIQSTNSLAAQLAEAGAPEGSIVVAEAQTRGRGRLGRFWHSPQGAGIYVSIILYPEIDPIAAPGLSILTAISLADTIADYSPGAVQVKWPNDCLINGRKAAGILTELSADMGHIHHVIVGVGINVNHRRCDFPPEISRTATSIRAELKQDIHRVEMLRRFLVRFEKDYRHFIKSGLKSHRKKILRYSNLIGNMVDLDMSGRIITGRAVDIDANGGLVLETAQGKRIFNAGEVTVVKRRQS